MIFLTGDTHSKFNRFSSHTFPEGKLLSKKDYVVILGDFGGFWRNTPSNEEIYDLKWLNDKPWTTLFLDGNHENFSILNSFPEKNMFEGKVGLTPYDSIFHLKRGEIYTLDNKKFFVFGGGLSIDKMRRVLGISFWNEEYPSPREIQNGLSNVAKHKNEVDFVLSHAIHKKGFDFIKNRESLYKGKETDALVDILEQFRTMLKYKHWFCGHYHFNLTDETTDTTVLYKKIIELV